MSSQFTFYRVLCCVTPELETEFDRFQEVLAQFQDEVTMPERVLFPAAAFRAENDPRGRRAAIESNIRICDFFVHLFGEEPAEAVYGDFVRYAIGCAADPGMPMHRPVVLFRDAGAVSAEMREWREGFAAECDVRTFAGLDELGAVLRGVFEAWYGSVRKK